MIIYTAIFGGYDELNEPLVITPGAKYICFTDQDLKSDVWDIIKINPKYDYVRQAREVKICLHRFLPDYKGLSIWVDANQKINADLTEIASLCTKNLMLLKHPDRNNIIDEAKECIRIKKDKAEVINEQINSYHNLIPHIKSDLVATGLMVKKYDTKLNAILDSWFVQITFYSCRDQLSFNAVTTALCYDDFTLIPYETLTKNFIRCKHKK